LGQPFDKSFDPDPTTADNTRTHCPYLTIGADITITHSANTSTFNFLDNAISSVTAYADKHLHKFECKKYMCNHKLNNNDPTSPINGDQVIGDLFQQNMVLLPFAINPHGCWGPILDHFLLQSSGNLQYTFPTNRPNAINNVCYIKYTTQPNWHTS
jgi:hypothetical protein